ncbi:MULTISPECIES: phosphotransferase [unclassified Vibrio]|uniref:phosphotransferase n=1 Tax=unclassified Vibrio TaxID=2614977 RepID=UPI0009EF3F34|nr:MULTISPECIES: phosphotransferase [unclassified Vibrio]
MNYLPLIEQLGFQQLNDTQTLQTLWGGYGELVRLSVDDDSIIVKHIALPEQTEHPKGWNTKRSHQRKIKSYQVELHWYQNYVATLHSNCPAPLALDTIQTQHSWLIVMQDLAQLGYINTIQTAEDARLKACHIEACLKWLAWFHASHIHTDHVHAGNIQTASNGLWQHGTYWHLETRPDELQALQDQKLKDSAHKIDQILNQAPYQTLLHGDAKLANFCFTDDGNNAAAVDFQYVGKGCAMKDVALFMSSAVLPSECATKEQWLLDTYFKHLKAAVEDCQPTLNYADIEQAWRPLFCVAWADFQRFVKGWSPNHWKINPYTEALTLQALKQC